MRTLEISAKLRKSTGKKETKKLRREQNVPCELYGYGKENIHFYAHENIFKNLVYTPHTFVTTLDIEGQKYRAVMKDIQFHPVTDKIQHIDFLMVQEERKIRTEVTIEIEGTPVGIAEGGILLRRARKLNVIGLPKHLPDDIIVNVEKLNIGDSINVRDLDVENLEILDAPNRVICSVQVAKMQIVEEEEEEGEEGEEGEEEGEVKAEEDDPKEDDKKESE